LIIEIVIAISYLILPGLSAWSFDVRAEGRLRGVSAVGRHQLLSDGHAGRGRNTLVLKLEKNILNKELIYYRV